MFELKRLQSSLQALVCVAAAVVALDAFMASALGEEPRWLPPIFGAYHLTDFQGRVAKFEDMEKSGRVVNARLVAVIGLSQVRHDMDPRQLAANDPLHRDWLVLGSEGRNFTQLAIVTRVLIDSSLKPALVVLGLAPSHTLREASDADNESALANLPRHLRHRMLWQALRDCSWLVRHRLRLLEASDILQYDATRTLRAMFGLPLSAFVPAEPDPWSVWPEPVTQSAAMPAADALYRARLALLAPEHFERNDAQIETFTQMVAALRRKGATVVCVLMPEAARLRDAYPPIAYASLKRALETASDGQAIPVTDCSTAMPDELFHDDAHLSTAGRRQFSAQFPKLLP